MKHIRYILLAAPLLLCGCNGTELLTKPAPSFDKTYEISAQIDYGSCSAAADITRNGTGDWKFSFTEPSYLMGMELTLADGKLTASLGDLSVSADSSEVYTLIPDVIASALDAVTTAAPETITESEGVLTLTAEACGEKAVVTADGSGNLLTLKCPSQQLAVTFSGQQEIAVTETAETYEPVRIIEE